MRKLILKMSVSIDGFAAGPNGEIDWIFKTMDESCIPWVMETLSQAGLHIMGSRTFHDMAAYWPSSDEPFAKPMNEIPKAVFTRKGATVVPDISKTTTAFRDAVQINHVNELTANNPNEKIRHSWNNPKVAGSDLVKDIAELKNEPGSYILAHGGAEFARSIIQAGLVDEYRLLIHPVILGKGLPVFSELSGPLRMKLVSTVKFNAGTVAYVYRPENNTGAN